MSQGESLAHLWPVVRDADLSFFISCAATTIYEHIITIQLEVHQIWKRDVSGATVLFVMTRYFMLLHRVFVIVGLSEDKCVSLVDRFMTPMSSCNIILWIQAITASALITVLSAIAAIRVYALWNRDIRLLALIMLTGIFPAFANLPYVSLSLVSIATRVISILSDGLVVVLTWMKTFRVYSLTRRVKLSADYSVLILRDGTVYFLAICILNMIAIVYITTTGTNLLNDLIVTLSAILMARFLLNLRDQRAHLEDKAWPMDNSSTINLTMFSSSSPMSSMCFRPGVLDMLGTSVTVGSHDSDGDMMNSPDTEHMDRDAGGEMNDEGLDEKLYGVKMVTEGASSWA
ncbi:hypothetical protein BC628DRAFT_1422297 [Trametes gibbosa]|nr:hypothetical protein BC628DRAFT_1422297 [Trametes gibbosa]